MIKWFGFIAALFRLSVAPDENKERYSGLHGTGNTVYKWLLLISVLLNGVAGYNGYMYFIVSHPIALAKTRALELKVIQLDNTIIQMTSNSARCPASLATLRSSYMTLDKSKTLLLTQYHDANMKIAVLDIKMGYLTKEVDDASLDLSKCNLLVNKLKD